MVKSEKIITLSARTLHGLFAVFTILFSFDVFGEQKPWHEIAIGFLIHNIPFFLLTASLLLSIRRPLIGCITLIALGILYLVWAWDRFPLSVYLLIDGPLFLSGSLYGIQALLSIQKKTTSINE